MLAGAYEAFAAQERKRAETIGGRAARGYVSRRNRLLHLFTHLKYKRPVRGPNTCRGL
jgi:hypothetical protein